MNQTNQLTMDFIISKGLNNKLKFLGIYNIAGGIIGLCLLIWIILKLPSIHPLLLLLLTISMVLYGYSITCGILILRKHPAGLRHSLLNQCLQIIAFSFIGIVFKYTSGIYAMVIMDLTESIGFGWDFGFSSFRIAISTEPTRQVIGINLVAIFMVYFIIKIKSTLLKEEKAWHTTNQSDLLVVETPEAAEPISFKRILDYIPLSILLVSALALLDKFIYGNIMLQTPHIIGLVLLLVPISVFFIHHKLGVLCMGGLMILGLFGIISFSPSITTISLTKTISEEITITYFYCQPIFLLWLSIHLILSWRYYRCILTKRYWENIYSNEPMKIE